MAFDKKKKNYRTTTIFEGGRCFKIEFWDSSDFNLPYVRICEIKKTRVKAHWWSDKTVERDVEQLVDMFWTDQDRVKCAKYAIRKYIEKEEERRRQLLAIDDFCYGVRDDND